MVDSFDAFPSRLERDEIAQRSDLRGCTPKEIEVLESKYNLALPHSYRQFLELMGHAAGRLFRYDHWEASYNDVLRLTEEERSFSADEGELPMMDSIVTASSLIILGRLSEQFLFIRCDDSSDSAVHYYNNSTWETHQAYDTVLDYLNAIADECAEAVRGGYFRNK